MNGQNLPNGWVNTCIMDIAEINPRYPSIGDAKDRDVSFVPMKCVEEQTGQIDLSYSRKLSEVRKGYTYFTDGDLLFAKITPCMENGKIAIAKGLTNGLGFGSTEFHVLRSPEPVLATLLFYFLLQESVRRDARKGMTGSAGQLRVPARFLEGLDFPLPPLPEQHRIVAKIEELFSDLDAGVEALKKVKAELKRYRQAVLKAAVEGKLTEVWRRRQGDSETRGRGYESAHDLLERIRKETGDRRRETGKAKALQPIDKSTLPKLPEGWEWTRVQELNPASRHCAYGVLQPGQNVEKGIPLVRVGDIDDGRVGLNDLKRISPAIAARYPRTKLQGGEVLITLVGAIGRTAVVPPVLAGANTARAVGVIPLVGGVLPEWVEIWFRNPDKAREMSGKAHEVARKTLNLEDVRAAAVALPPYVEQQRIVSEVERRLSVADEVEKTVEASLKQSERLRQSILKRAFEGKLVPQDPSDPPASELLERIKRERESQKLRGLEAKKLRGKKKGGGMQDKRTRKPGRE